MRYFIPSIVLIMIAIILSFFIGCATPFYKTEITSTTSLSKFESGLWGYQQDLQNPDRAIRLPGCEGVAAREYFKLKSQEYPACIMAGYSKEGVPHAQASIMRNGIPLDLYGMQVTHILTESEIWRIQN